MLLQVSKEWDYQRQSNSRKSGMDGMSCRPSDQIHLITASKNQLLSTCSYKFLRIQITRVSRSLGNKELMGLAPQHAHKYFSSQLVKTTSFQHAFTTFQRVILWTRVKPTQIVNWWDALHAERTNTSQDSWKKCYFPYAFDSFERIRLDKTQSRIVNVK